jgi:hypothetical protein
MRRAGAASGRHSRGPGHCLVPAARDPRGAYGHCHRGPRRPTGPSRQAARQRRRAGGGEAARPTPISDPGRDADCAAFRRDACLLRSARSTSGVVAVAQHLAASLYGASSSTLPASGASPSASRRCSRRPARSRRCPSFPTAARPNASASRCARSACQSPTAPPRYRSTSRFSAEKLPPSCIRNAAASRPAPMSISAVRGASSPHGSFIAGS